MGPVDQSLLEKVKDLEGFITQSSFLELHTAYVTIVDTIFGLSDNQPGWNLCRLRESDDAHAFNAVRKFLSPSGLFLDSVISELATENATCKYEFPIYLLSVHSQMALSNSAQTGAVSSTVSLNAFEYYMFNFLSNPLHPEQRKDLELQDFVSSVYAAIYTDYLEFYFFVDLTSFAVLTSRFQFVKTIPPQNTIYQRNYFTERNPRYLSETMDIQHQSPEQHLLWKTETFFQAVFEFLLSWRSSVFQQQLHLPGGIADNPFTKGLAIPPSHSELSFKPTTCHLYMVRCFLKYLYYIAFHHSHAGPLQTPHQQQLYTKVASYHRYLFNSLCSPPSDATSNNLHRNLMAQVKQLIIFCFQHWTMDLSFELVVETWLTSIQPWRYAQTPRPYGSSPVSEQRGLDGNLSTPLSTASQPYSWTAFATQQYGLYVVPLLLFLQRSVHMDLRVYRNAHMVYRVAKVFTQPGMRELLSGAEETLLQQSVSIKRTGALPVGDVPNVLSTVEQTGLWGPVFTTAVAALLVAISAATNEVQIQTSQKNQTNASRGVWCWIVDSIVNVLLENDDRERMNLQKCSQCLRDASSMFRGFFTAAQSNAAAPTASILKTPPGQIQWDDMAESPLLPAQRMRADASRHTPHRRVQFASDTSSGCNESSQNTTASGDPNITRKSDSRFPDVIVTEYGQQLLTPLGRYQILMGQRRPEIKVQGDREYLPACTYEMPMLVELCRALSGLINSKMHTRFLVWCSTPGLRGWVARRLLLPRDSVSVVTEGHGPIPSATKTHIMPPDSPRISLRWLASYVILARVALLYLLVFTLAGIRSPVSFFFILLLGCTVYQLMRLAFWLVQDLYNGCKVF